MLDCGEDKSDIALYCLKYIEASILEMTKYKVGMLFLAGLSIDQLEIAWNSKYSISFDEVQPYIMMIDDSSYKGSHIYKFD